MSDYPGKSDVPQQHAGQHAGQHPGRQSSPQAPVPSPGVQPSAGGSKKIALIILAVVGVVSFVIVAGCAGIYFFMLKPAVDESKQAVSRNNLKIIGVAIQNYHDTYKQFPFSTSTDKQGEPYRSWRVSVLWFTNYQKDYERFDQKKAWNDPVNQAAAGRIPEDVYHSLLDPGPARETSYVAITGPKAAFLSMDDIKVESDNQTESPAGNPDSRRMEDMLKGMKEMRERGPGMDRSKTPTLARIKDGIQNTIIVIEVQNSGIPWNQPGDMTIEQAIGAIKKSPQPFTNALFGDGSVHRVSRDTPEDILRHLMTIDDGVVPKSEWEK